MSIFYEENEIGGDYDQEKDDFTHPNHEHNYSDDSLYDEFNKLGDSYIKIKEYASIFHDLVTVEEETVYTEGKQAPDHPKSLDLQHNVYGRSRGEKIKSYKSYKADATASKSNNRFDRPMSRAEAFGNDRKVKNRHVAMDAVKKEEISANRKKRTAIPGSDKDVAADHALKNVEKHHNMSDHDADKLARHKAKTKHEAFSFLNNDII